MVGGVCPGAEGGGQGAFFVDGSRASPHLGRRQGLQHEQRHLLNALGHTNVVPGFGGNPGGGEDLKLQHTMQEGARCSTCPSCRAHPSPSPPHPVGGSPPPVGVLEVPRLPVLKRGVDGGPKRRVVEHGGTAHLRRGTCVREVCGEGVCENNSSPWRAPQRLRGPPSCTHRFTERHRQNDGAIPVLERLPAAANERKSSTCQARAVTQPPQEHPLQPARSHCTPNLRVVSLYWTSGQLPSASNVARSCGVCVCKSERAGRGKGGGQSSTM